MIFIENERHSLPPPFRFVDLKRGPKILIEIDLTVKKWMGLSRLLSIAIDFRSLV